MHWKLSRCEILTLMLPILVRKLYMLLLKILLGPWVEYGPCRHWDASLLEGESCATTEGGFGHAHINPEGGTCGREKQEGTVLAGWFLSWRDMEPRWPVSAGASYLCQRPKIPLWSSLDSSLWCLRNCILKCFACGYPGDGLLWSVLSLKLVLLFT